MERRLHSIALWLAVVLGIVSAVHADSLDIPPELAEIYAGQPPQTLQQLQAMETHQRKLAALVTRATVGIRVGASQGSGVIVSKDGLILTAAHVASRPHAPCLIILHDGRQVFGKTLGLNRTRDAGMVKIDATQPSAAASEGQPEGDGGENEQENAPAEMEWPFLDLASGEELKQGMWCVATGHPGGYERGREPVVRVGRILFTSTNLIRTDCVLVGGDSGGPLCDMQGRVIGIHSRIGGPITMNLHVPIGPFRESWDRLLAGDAWGTLPGSRPVITGAAIGVRADPSATDARIGSVEPGMPAAKAGIQAGDVILKFDGEPVPDFATLAKLVRAHEPGDQVLVELRRGDEMIQLKITIGQRTP